VFLTLAASVFSPAAAGSKTLAATPAGRFATGPFLGFAHVEFSLISIRPGDEFFGVQFPGGGSGGVFRVRGCLVLAYSTCCCGSVSGGASGTSSAVVCADNPPPPPAPVSQGPARSQGNGGSTADPVSTPTGDYYSLKNDLS